MRGAVAVVGAVLVLLVSGTSIRAATSAPLNPIQVENALPGTTAWQAQAGGDIAVYASQISAGVGDELDFHVSTAYPLSDRGVSAGLVRRRRVRAWSGARPAAARTSRAGCRGRRSGPSRSVPAGR